MALDRSFPLPPNTKDHPDPHEPQRGRAVFPRHIPCLEAAILVEQSDGGVYEVTYWGPEPLGDRGDGHVYDLDRCVATWRRIQSKTVDP